MKKEKIGLISLGCARNLVDSELMLGELASCGYTITDRMEGVDVAIINTCGFIEDAKREAIDIIIQAASLKKEGKIRKLIVTGCLSQRYAKELKKDIPEIDALLGIDDFKNIKKAVAAVLKDRSFVSINPPRALYSHKDPRVLITPAHYAYIKIAEGCRNRCSYCAIYKIRGDFRSRPISSVLDEVRNLTEKGKISELNIIAQDTTSYGIDRYGKLKLPILLKKICSLNRAHWIRLLYTHPRHFTDELIETIAAEPSICKYIDLPIQHISDRILKQMNRKVNRRQIELLISKIRKNIPGIALRTSLIIGFPGETEAEFESLLEFIEDVQFERLGAFIYSREEGTPACRFKDQISEPEKKRRFERLMRSQQKISARINERFVGRDIEVLIEEQDKQQRKRYIGRTEYDAPEVDGEVYVSSKRPLRVGEFVDVKITDTMEYDLVGTSSGRRR
jgi:ribosomal protein S12 methylthiotransferase